MAALWAVERREGWRAQGGRRQHLAQALDSIHVLKCMFVRPQHLLGPIGTALYWFGDIFCLWACLQAFTHGTPNISLLLLGYAAFNPAAIRKGVRELASVLKKCARAPGRSASAAD